MLSKLNKYIPLLKLCLAVGTLLFIFFKISNDRHFNQDFWDTLGHVSGSWSSPLFLLFVLLIPVNWGLEAYKWHFLANKSDPLPLKDALFGVLSGLCLGFITPHAIGDYAGRVAFLPAVKRIPALAAVALARISLFFITLFYGVAGFFVFTAFLPIDTPFFNVYALGSTLVFFASALWILYNFRVLFRLLKKIPQLERVLPYLQLLERYTYSELNIVFILSFVRFMVFSIQYALILGMVGANPWEVVTWSAIWLVFFSKSVIPSFNFISDVSVREAASLFFFSKIGLETGQIITASLGMWLFNILLPTFFGLLIILSRKIRL